MLKLACNNLRIQNASYLLLVFLFWGCQSSAPIDPNYQNPLEVSTDEINEGFYPVFPLQSFPVEKANSFGFDIEKVKVLIPHSGLLFSEREVKISAKSIDRVVKGYCSNEAAKAMSPEFCSFVAENMESCSSNIGCTYTGQVPSCSGVRYRNFFLTARHCMPKDAFPKEPFAKFMRLDGTIRVVKLRRTQLLQHRSPYDVSVFRMFGARFSDEPIPMRRTRLEFREPVMGLGWPVLHVRKDLQTKFDYDLEYKHLRATFGRVTQPNEMGRSFCHFTNQDGVTDIEKWELENGCKRAWFWRKEKGFKKPYYAREERDPFLVDSDMTWGMSGSPLFDRSGRLVGIGSNVLNNDPRQYNRNKYAVYVKAERIYELLESIEPRLKHSNIGHSNRSESNKSGN